MVQYPPKEAAAKTIFDGLSPTARPPGIGLSALALLASLAIWIIQKLLELGSVGLGKEWSGGHDSRTALLLQICMVAGIGVVCLWQYWKGRNWARSLVLLGSVATILRALSFLAEHNFDPAALMGRPLSFFQALLAVVLLYWLNTPKVRAWYRNSSADAGDQIAGRLRGRVCTGVEFHSDAGLWHLFFEHDAELGLRCPWRIVLDDNLAFATTQDGEMSSVDPASRSASAPLANQQAPATVPAPGHSPQEARRLLENLRVRAVRLAPHSSDLFVSFEMGIELQTWSTSSTESGPALLWKYSDPALTVIADGARVHAQAFAAPDDVPDLH